MKIVMIENKVFNVFIFNVINIMIQWTPISIEFYNLKNIQETLDDLKSY